MNDYIVKMENICKTFPGVKALDNVSLYLKKGRVMALLGENGAGKSTLMKVLSGIHKYDSGTIIYCAQADFSRVFSDNDGICCCVQLLQYIPCKNRQHKQKKFFAYRAFGKVDVLYGFFHRSPFECLTLAEFFYITENKDYKHNCRQYQLI